MGRMWQHSMPPQLHSNAHENENSHAAAKLMPPSFASSKDVVNMYDNPPCHRLHLAERRNDVGPPANQSHEYLARYEHRHDGESNVINRMLNYYDAKNGLGSIQGAIAIVWARMGNP